MQQHFYHVRTKGVIKHDNVRMLGTSLETIKTAEERSLFKNLLQSIGEPLPESATVNTVAEAIEFAQATGFPLIIRPSYTLGGTGGGFAHNIEELETIVSGGLASSMSHQVLIEKSLVGWKEIEYEVMRDSADNCITICNMENIDPMGVHTGDSIVVAPSQTLSDKEYQMLRSASLKIIRALGIEGGCNVQADVAGDHCVQRLLGHLLLPRIGCVRLWMSGRCSRWTSVCGSGGASNRLSLRRPRLRAGNGPPRTPPSPA